MNIYDIDEATKTCCIPVMSLIFDKKNTTKFVITLEFHTFEHIKNKKSLTDYITTNTDILISGFYAVYLKTYNNNILKKTKLDILDKICDKANMIYLLIKYISDERVSKIILL
jgi:hypothetical protein